MEQPRNLSAEYTATLKYDIQIAYTVQEKYCYRGILPIISKDLKMHSVWDFQENWQQT
jgi:hypothetical protein